jgi:hypothetical protein
MINVLFALFNASQLPATLIHGSIAADKLIMIGQLANQLAGKHANGEKEFVLLSGNCQHWIRNKNQIILKY